MPISSFVRPHGGPAISVNVFSPNLSTGSRRIRTNGSAAHAKTVFLRIVFLAYTRVTARPPWFWDVLRDTFNRHGDDVRYIKYAYGAIFCVFYIITERKIAPKLAFPARKGALVRLQNLLVWPVHVIYVQCVVRCVTLRLSEVSGTKNGGNENENNYNIDTIQTHSGPGRDEYVVYRRWRTRSRDGR